MIMISPAEVRAIADPDHSSTLDPNEAAKLKVPGKLAVDVNWDRLSRWLLGRKCRHPESPAHLDPNLWVGRLKLLPHLNSPSPSPGPSS